MTWVATSYRCFIALAALVLAMSLSGVSAAAAGHSGAVGFEAFLFNSRTGGFSKDVLAADTSLGNVPAGEFASVSTFVVVQVAFGSNVPIPRNGTVHLIAAERSKTARQIILNRTVRLGPAGAGGVTNVGFWLEATGCNVIALHATVTGGKAPMTGDASLAFACYE